MKTVEEVSKEFDEVFVPRMNALTGRDMMTDLICSCGPEDAVIIFNKYRASYAAGYMSAAKEFYDVLLK
jgi:hypothetical protein